MAPDPIGTYLDALDPQRRTTLSVVRTRINDHVAGLEECISYRHPAFRHEGIVIAGIAAFSRHLSYLPHSGSVLDALGDELDGFARTKSALHFPLDQPLDPALVGRLLDVRLTEARTRGR